MIRLTLDAQSDPKIHMFHKNSVLLGSDSSRVDLVISGFGIEPIHLELVSQEGAFFLINKVNDPFATVNGDPFGKKGLQTGDIIHLHHTTILFENLNSLAENARPEFQHASEKREEKFPHQNKNSQTFSLEKKSAPFALPFENEVNAFEDSELAKRSLEQIMQEVRASQDPHHSPPSAIKEKPTSIKHSANLKADHLRDFEEEHHPTAPEAPAPNKDQRPLNRAWRWIFLFIASVVIISTIAGTITYMSISDKTKAQEIKAAQGAADLAMALLHAKFNHLTPHNQNWSDVEFLKSNLQAILPESSSHASQIDSHGQFNCCPYTLRVFTNADFSHFLLIAQPTPNLLYWLIPQSIIMIDSQIMELRTVKDVRNLNRLLANPDPLEGVNGKELTDFIKNGEMISLSQLSSLARNTDFATPKNLAWILPGAENLIYNAPRYYRLGQTIVHKAISLSTSKSSSQEVMDLKQQVENFVSLNRVVLYSDQGKKSALLTRQAIALFAPSDTLLFGYVLFNAKGKIHQAHLLTEDGDTEPRGPSDKESHEDAIALETAGESNGKVEGPQTSENPLIDRNHPIFIELQALIKTRENELKPLITALYTLIDQELANPRSQFQVEYQNLSHSYLMANAKLKESLKEAIEALYEKYENIPIHQFIAYMQELHLEHLIQQEDQKLAVEDENCQQNMDALLTHIENSKSLSELNHVVHIANSWLNFDYIKNPNELLRYQNMLRNHLLEQLEKCLLTQKTHIAVRAEDKDILQDILHQERLIKPEERDFFLEEFDGMFSEPRDEIQGEQNKENRDTSLSNN